MLSWMVLLAYLPVTFTFGGFFLEQILRQLNRCVWVDDPAESPSDERMLAAWGIQNLQPFAIGVVLASFVTAIERTPLTPTVAFHEIGLPLFAVAVTVPPFGTALGLLFRLPLARGVLLSAISTTLMMAIAVLVSVGVVLLWGWTPG